MHFPKRITVVEKRCLFCCQVARHFVCLKVKSLQTSWMRRKTGRNMKRDTSVCGGRQSAWDLVTDTWCWESIKVPPVPPSANLNNRLTPTLPSPAVMLRLFVLGSFITTLVVAPTLVNSSSLQVLLGSFITTLVAASTPVNSWSRPCVGRFVLTQSCIFCLHLIASDLCLCDLRLWEADAGKEPISLPFIDFIAAILPTSSEHVRSRDHTS